MRKLIILILFLILMFLFVGCQSSNATSSDTSTQIVVLPDTETAKNVNGYKNESSDISSANDSTSLVVSSTVTDTVSSEPVSSYYVGNKNSKKFHTQYCKYISSISDKNLHTFETEDDALNEGYSPCGHCMKK